MSCAPHAPQRCRAGQRRHGRARTEYARPRKQRVREQRTRPQHRTCTPGGPPILRTLCSDPRALPSCWRTCESPRTSAVMRPWGSGCTLGPPGPPSSISSRLTGPVCCSALQVCHAKATSATVATRPSTPFRSRTEPISRLRGVASEFLGLRSAFTHPTATAATYPSAGSNGLARIVARSHARVKAAPTCSRANSTEAACEGSTLPPLIF